MCLTMKYRTSIASLANMFTALNKLLDIDNQINTPKGKYFLLSESYNDGSFLLHHFLSFYLKGGYNVCFIALAQSFTHYSSVAQKLGVNLTTSMQNGKLTFVEGLKYAVQSMELESSDGVVPASLQNNPLSGLTNLEQRFSLKELFKKVSEEISKFGTDEPFLLLFDDISVFLSLGVSMKEIQSFVHYCYITACAQEKAGCLVTLVHADHDEGDSEEEILERQLAYKCDLELHVKGLSTGYCKEVHGQLEIIDHDVAMEKGRPAEKVVQYKIMDKSVSFFAPGNSESVL